MTTYKYPSRNLLEEPEYYMYSGYHGKEFLQDYMSQRRDFVSELESRYLKFLSNEQPQFSLDYAPIMKYLLEDSPVLFSVELRQITGHLLGDRKTEKRRIEVSVEEVGALTTNPEIPTELLLRTILYLNLEHSPDSDDLQRKWLDRYLKRFEVSKKLYSLYSPKMKAIGKNVRVLLNYILLSTNLVLIYQESGNLKYLNGVLKLNDLICSAQPDLIEPVEIYMTIFAVGREMEYVSDIAAAQGVKF